MKSILPLCVLGFLLVACAGSHRGASGPENSESGWLEVGSAHFVLRTDLDSKEAARVSAKLEEAYGAISTLGFESAAPPSFTIDVIYFRDKKTFAEVAPRGAIGFFVPNGLHDFERRPFAVLGGDFVDETREVLQHELTHLFVSHYYPQVPVWLNEGFARYLETIKIDDGVATLGRAPRQQRFWRGAWGQDPKTGAVNLPMGQAPTTASLRAMAPSEFYGAWSNNRYDNSDAAKVAAIHYQAAWCLVHMLIESPKYAPFFTQYLNRIHEGERDGVAWEKTLGTLDPELLEADYKVALMPNEVTLQRSKYTAAADAPEHVAAMSNPPVHALMARLRDWNSDDGRRAAEADLAEARRGAETTEVAEVDAMWALHQKNPKAAEQLLREAVARNGADPSLWNALGWVVLHESNRLTLEDRQAAMAQIAAKLAPIAKSAAQLDLLGTERLLAGKPDDALAYEKRALGVDSNCTECLATTAAALLKKGLPNEALDVANLGLGISTEGARPARLMMLAERAQNAIQQNRGGGELATTPSHTACKAYSPRAAQTGELPSIAESERMAKPTLLCVPAITYSKEALQNKVGGLAIGKCILELDGSVSNCRLIKSLPYMDENLLDAFRSLRYSPVILDGHPQRVEIAIPLRVPKP